MVDSKTKRLIYKLEAQNAQYLKKLDQSQKKLDRFAARAKRNSAVISSSLKKAFAFVASGLIVRQVASYTSNTLKAIDANAKFADSVRLSTEELAGYQLQSDITGASLEQFQKGVIRLQKSIADGVNGLSTAIRAFDKLNLDPESLRLLDTNEQLKIIADSFKGLENQTDRTSVAVDLFGRAGVGLIKFLEEGSEGIDAFKQEAEALGLSLSRIDAAKVEAANDALTRSAAVAKGLGQAFGVALSPLIEGIANDFSESAKQAGGFSRVVESGITKAVRVVGVFADGIQVIKLAFIGLKIAIGEVVLSLTKIPRAVSGIGEDLAKKLGLEGVAENLDVINDVFQSVTDELDRNKEALARKAEETIPSERMLARLEELRADAEERAKAVAQSIEQGLQGGAIIDPQVVAETEKNIADVVTNVDEGISEMSTFADQAARNMQDSFADFLFDPLEDGFDGLVDNFARTLRRMAAEAAAAKIFDALKAGSGGSSGGLLGGVADLFAGLFNNGGNVPAGQFGIAGERGPEFVKGPAQVTSTAETSRAIGGLSIENMSISIPNASPMEAKRAAGQIIREVNATMSLTGRYA